MDLARGRLGAGRAPGLWRRGAAALCYAVAALAVWLSLDPTSAVASQPPCTIIVGDRDAAKGLGREVVSKRTDSIQGAVENARPGDRICVVSDVHHNERVVITKSGTPERPIHLEALGYIRTAGFVVTADHVRIENFAVSNLDHPDESGRAMGIYLAGTGIEVIGNVVFDTAGDGIGCEHIQPYCPDATITDNEVIGANGVGILVAGDRILVERNDVSRSIMRGVSDADGIRFFGSDIVLRENVVHDISDQGYPPDGKPHTDCFQTFDISKPSSRAVLIERNICDNVDHQCINIEGEEKRRTARIVFRYNVCANNGSQAVYIRDVNDIEIRGNLFLPSIRYFGISLDRNASDISILGNTFVGGFRPYIASDSASGGLRADGNLVYSTEQTHAPQWWDEPHGAWGGSKPERWRGCNGMACDPRR